MKTFYVQLDEDNVIRDIVSFPFEDYIQVEFKTPLPVNIYGGSFKLIDGKLTKID